MGESLLTSLCMENHHHPSTLLSMDPTGVLHLPSPPHGSSTSLDEMMVIQRPQVIHPCPPPDINLPLSSDRCSPSPPQLWNPIMDSCDILDVSLGPHQIQEAETFLNPPKTGARKCIKRGDSIWGAWFFFSYYFKPVLVENSKAKVAHDANGILGVDKSDLRLDVFLVQHDMENMYMWVFKEKPENALGKMQLRSYMNGHSRHGEPQFPFSAERGFVRSHRMQRKHYRGLSNPQCLHGIEIVRSPNLTAITELDRKKWMELTGREMNFTIPLEASDFGSWRNLLSTEFELDRPLSVKNGTVQQQQQQQRKLLNGSSLNLLSNHCNGDVMDLSTVSSKRKKDLPHGMDDDCYLLTSSHSDHSQDVEMRPAEPSWLNEFSGVMKHAFGPVTAAKTIYEDDQGYLIVVSLPFADLHRVKVSWKNTLTRGIVKIQCVSTARMPYLKRHDRTFKLTDSSPEHCPPGEFVREIPLATRIPDDATLEAYYDESGTVLEILVPKHRAGPEEHEVRVCLRPHLATNELMLT